MKFNIVIDETSTFFVTVDAPSEAEALEVVRKNLDNGSLPMEQEEMSGGYEIRGIDQNAPESREIVKVGFNSGEYCPKCLGIDGLCTASGCDDEE